jgi:hypothetical protein
MTKIAFEIKNYKKIKEMNFDLNDYDAIIVSGKNRKGKSSLINGLFENLTAKNLSDEPLLRGADKGEKSVIINDKNGEEIKIVHTFSKKEPRGTFYAIKDGQKISSVTKIRELIGDANNYTIDDFFKMCKDVPGRRKFIKEILMRLMTPKQLEDINIIDAKINSKNGTLYTKRTDLNTELKVLENTPNLSEEEKETLNNKSNIEKIILDKTNEKNNLELKYSILNKIYNLILNAKNGNGWSSILKEEIIFKNEDATKLFSNLIDNEKQVLTYETICFNGMIKINSLIEEINDILINNQNILNSISNIEYKKNSFGDIELKIKNKKEEIENINNDINKAIEEKSKIMASSNLPKGLIIHDESEFTYNGFNFNENEISESEGWLLLAELTIPLYDCKYFRMGNASIYGKEALDALMAMAAENGKILALEKVVDDRDDIYVEGIVYDVEDIKDNKTNIIVNEESIVNVVEKTIVTNDTIIEERPGDRFMRLQNEKLEKEQSSKLNAEDVVDDNIKKLNDLF